MHIVLVYIHVKPDSIYEFKEAAIENARNSAQEPGIARFDFIQQQDDPTRFMLVEIYKDVNAQRLHKETPHYAKWKQTVEAMMAEPRYGVNYTNVFPDEAGW
jgi:autoinducer 2-degrading protein